MKRACGCFFILVFFLTACATDMAMNKRKAEDKRKIAGAYIGQKNYTEALKELLDAEKLYPDDPELQNELGFVYMEKEKPDLAIQHLRRALELKPDYSAAKNTLGVAYMKNEQWDEAITCFKGLSENLLYTTPQYPLFNLGWAYYQKKDFAQSEKYYKKAIGLFDEGQNKDAAYIKALHGLSLTYTATGRSREAVVLLEKAVQFAPRIAELYFDLGRAYIMAQEYPKALKAYNKVIELIPDRSLAREATIAAEEIKRTYNLK
ncbi:MAG: tetratricopeptide repeat protein [Calditrichales bacterium]|nr:MAG: tetratricopeptide repeat protein [Calditrichales bacterium]